jgi:hypothetical protein
LLLEFVQEVAAFSIELFRRKLSIFELLHLFLAHVPSGLSLRKLLAQFRDTYASDLLFL